MKRAKAQKDKPVAIKKQMNVAGRHVSCLPHDASIENRFRQSLIPVKTGKASASFGGETSALSGPVVTILQDEQPDGAKGSYSIDPKGKQNLVYEMKESPAFKPGQLIEMQTIFSWQDADGAFGQDRVWKVIETPEDAGAQGVDDVLPMESLSDFVTARSGRINHGVAELHPGLGYIGLGGCDHVFRNYNPTDYPKAKIIEADDAAGVIYADEIPRDESGAPYVTVTATWGGTERQAVLFVHAALDGFFMEEVEAPIDSGGLHRLVLSPQMVVPEPQKTLVVSYRADGLQAFISQCREYTLLDTRAPNSKKALPQVTERDQQVDGAAGFFIFDPDGKEEFVYELAPSPYFTPGNTLRLDFALLTGTGPAEYAFREWSRFMPVLAGADERGIQIIEPVRQSNLDRGRGWIDLRVTDESLGILVVQHVMNFRNHPAVPEAVILEGTNENIIYADEVQQDDDGFFIVNFKVEWPSPPGEQAVALLHVVIGGNIENSYSGVYYSGDVGYARLRSNLLQPGKCLVIGYETTYLIDRSSIDPREVQFIQSKWREYRIEATRPRR